MDILLKQKILRERHNRYDENLTLQVIAVAQESTGNLIKFMMKTVFFPYVCIGSYLEAAAFCGVEAKLAIVKLTEKNRKILEELNVQKDLITERIMIVCTNLKEAKELKILLELHKMKILCADSSMSIDHLQGVKQKWDLSISGMYPVIICTDDVLSSLHIQNITWLIHHSVNLPSKSRFYYRFSTMMDSWHQKSIKCKTLILVDNTNDVQFPGLVEIMQKLQVQVPPHVLHTANIVAMITDRKKISHPICDNVKTLGFCPKKSSCPYRHCILKGVDDPLTAISSGDIVELIVTYIHNATHFSARLVKFLKKDEKKQIVIPSDQSLRLTMQMQKYFSNTENRRGRKRVKTGDICALEDTVDNYIRVQIMNIVMKNDSDEALYVTVRCIDDGRVQLKVRASKLLEIPENLAKWESNIVEVFIGGVVPFDNEYEWDYYANKAVESWFKDNLDSRSFIVAKVDLHIGNTIWTNTLEMRSKLIGLPEFTGSSLRTILIRDDAEGNNSFGTINENHLPMLYKLCKAGGMTLGIDCESTDSEKLETE